MHLHINLVRIQYLQSEVGKQTYVELEECAVRVAAQRATAKILMGCVQKHQGGGQHGSVWAIWKRDLKGSLWRRKHQGITQGIQTRSQQTFIIPYRRMLSKHTVKSSLLMFDNTIQDQPRQNREEIRLLGIVGNVHAKINQLKTQQPHNKLKFHRGWLVS